MRYRTLIFLLTTSAFLHTSPLHGQLKRHLYIANDDHTDYIWTADAETYRQAFINQLDYYIALMETQNDTLPHPFQHRYNCDNSLWVYEYEKGKSVADFQRLIDKIKSGHISVPFNPLVPVYGAQNAEIAIRGMYYGGYLERRYGLDIDLAVMMENQTMPLGIASIWAGAGVKYSWKGVCSCASPYLNYHDRKHEVYYARGLDGQGILMKWYDLITNQHLGGYAECRYPNQAIEDLREKCNTLKYPFEVAGAFGYGWDDLENYIDFFPERARANSDSDQTVFVSNEIDFFQEIEARYPEFIPTQSLSYGNDWDLLVATMAQVSGDVKRSAAKLRSAEAMASFIAIKDTSFAQDLKEERELAWISLGKYYDHDWTADGPVSSGRAQFQRDMAHHFISYVDTLFDRSLYALGGMIKTSGSEELIFIFNPLSWDRTDIADFAYDGLLPVTAFDLTTNEEVPTQIVHKQGTQYVRLLASNIPSVGYKVYSLKNMVPADQTPTAMYSDNVFESERYTLITTPNGTISSLVDKWNENKEWVGSSPMNEIGPGNPNDGEVYLEDPAGPVSATIKMTSSSPFPHETEITMFRQLPRIDIHNRLTGNPGNSTLTFTYPVAVDDPTVWHEEIGAVIKAKKQSHGGHYADQNARYDWQTANQFVFVGNDQEGMTISNLGAHFFKLGHSTIEEFDDTSNEIHFLATGKVAYGTIGINNQGGDTQFDYNFSLIPHQTAFDQASSMKLAMEHQTPLVTGEVSGGDEYPATSFSLLQIDDPKVLLWALKPSEEGPANGIIARVWNQGDETEFNLTSSIGIKGAFETSHVEKDIKPLIFETSLLSDTLLGQQLKTYRIILADSAIQTNSDFLLAVENDYMVFPNPTNGQCYIRSLIHEPHQANVMIINASGDVIQEWKMAWSGLHDQEELNLDQLPAGFYLIKISSHRGIQGFKMVVE
jgi:alpha-mannosidase